MNLDLSIEVLEKLKVKRVEVQDGDPNIVILAKCKSSLNRLIAAHNQLIAILEFEVGHPDKSENSTENAPKRVQNSHITPLITTEVPSLVNQQRDCIDLLLQMGYTCIHVGPIPFKTATAKWCQACKRLITEDDHEPQSY